MAKRAGVRDPHTETVVRNDGGTGHRIDTLWAFLAIQPGDEDEGVIALPHAGGGGTPMIASDRVRVSMMRPVAAKVAGAAGLKVVLARFGSRVDEETL